VGSNHIRRSQALSGEGIWQQWAECWGVGCTTTAPNALGGWDPVYPQIVEIHDLDFGSRAGTYFNP
jgi:hypothetical protein